MELVSGVVVGFLLGFGAGWFACLQKGRGAAVDSSGARRTHGSLPPANPSSPSAEAAAPPASTELPPTGSRTATGEPEEGAFSTLLSAMLEQSPQAIAADYRQNLRRKCLFDEAAVDRLVAFEREQDPSGDEVAWLRAAVRRWENDNR